MLSLKAASVEARTRKAIQTEYKDHASRLKCCAGPQSLAPLEEAAAVI